MAGAVRIGIALGATRAVAAVLGRRNGPRVEEARQSPGGESVAVELFTTFTRLAGALQQMGVGSTDGARVHLCLAPPLADARLVELPPLREDELLGVLQRDLARHFLGASGPRVVGILERSRSSAGRPVLVAAAELSILDAAREAVQQMGWSLESVGVAHGTWIAEGAGLGATGTCAIVAVEGAAAHVIRLEDGAVTKLRRAAASDAEGLVEALGPGPGRLLVLAPSRVRDALGSHAARAGWVLSPTVGGEALHVAADRAANPRLELVPPALAVQRGERRRSRAVRLGFAAAALLVASAGAHLWGVQRDVSAVRANRLQIADQVSPLLLARDSLERLTDRVVAMRNLAGATPRWTPVLAELASLLPRDSYLTGLFASGDTLELEAAGSRAGEAIQQLRASGTFTDVRLEGVVERELENGETVVERFRVSARLVPQGAGTQGGTQ